MPGIRERDGAVGGDAEGEASGVSFAAAEETAVEGFEDSAGIVSGFDRAARGSDEERDEHASFESFAGDVAGDDEERAVGGVGDDLEEVAADFEGRSIFAFDCETGKNGAGLGQDDLLDFLGLFDVEGEAALIADGVEEAAEEKEGEGGSQEEDGEVVDGELNAKGEPDGADVEEAELGGEASDADEEDGGNDEPAFESLGADTFNDSPAEQGEEEETNDERRSMEDGHNRGREGGEEEVLRADDGDHVEDRENGDGTGQPGGTMEMEPNPPDHDPAGEQEGIEKDIGEDVIGNIAEPLRPCTDAGEDVEHGGEQKDGAHPEVDTIGTVEEG